MLIPGWKKKAERLKTIVLTGGHQLAQELSPSCVEIFALLRKAAGQGADIAQISNDINRVTGSASTVPMVSEPLDAYGWRIRATLYKERHQFWWLVHAERAKLTEPPRPRDIVILHNIIAHLGGDPERDMMIGPTSSPEGEPALPFGWWTWINQHTLLEMQGKGTGRSTQLRIVPVGSPETDGFRRM